MADTERRRRRVRHEPSTDAPGPDELSASVETAPVHDPEVDPVPVARATPDRPVPGARIAPVPPDSHPTAGDRADDRDTERGLRGLVGAGSSQVRSTAAMRARDAARPTEADLAAAETDLVIIRRGWVPRDPLTPR